MMPSQEQPQISLAGEIAERYRDMPRSDKAVACASLAVCGALSAGVAERYVGDSQALELLIDGLRSVTGIAGAGLAAEPFTSTVWDRIWNYTTE